MAYQFFHIDAVSNEERELYIIKNKKKIIIGHISTKSVLGEAGRLEGYISHIDNPQRPVVLYGDKEKGIEDVRQKIENWVEGTKDARGHKVRKDANSLLSGVVSWPPINDDEDEKEYDDRRKAFEKALLVWLKNVYGDDLVLVLRHEDEPFRGINAGKIHYHWHYYCVKKPGKKFDLHPGFNARSKKDISRKDKKNMNADEIKTALKEGRVAYRKAMSDFQERFYQELGKDHGLGRYGPRRERRSRSEQLEFEVIRDKVIEDAKEKAEMNADEINKQTNEIKRQANEDKRKAEEAKRQANEDRRQAEAVRKQAEEDRKQADEDRRQADAVRKQVDEDRRKAEAARKQADEDKRKADAARKQADEDRRRAEESKMQAEEDRRKAEEAKKQAETILEKSRNFVNMLFEKISKLPGGTSIVKWAWTFIKPKKPDIQGNEPVRNNTQNKTKTRK